MKIAAVETQNISTQGLTMYKNWVFSKKELYNLGLNLIKLLHWPLLTPFRD